jgi:hypothetical protein
MNRVTFDEKVEVHLNEIMNRLRQMGIKNVSKPMALRVIIEMNKEAAIRLKRKRSSKYGLLFQ